MTELSLTVPTKTDLERESTTWADRARDLKIVDAPSCVQASLLLRSIKGLRTDIANWFAPHVEAAMETKRKAEAARKGLVDEKDRMEAPLVAAEAVVKRTLLVWEEEQERLRLAEERRLQLAADTRASEIALEVSAAMELEAHQRGDAEMLREAHDLLAQPSEGAVVSVARTIPKVQGITYRDAWKAHDVVDTKALAAAVAAGIVPAIFLTANMTALNKFASATKGTENIPGVKFFNDRQIAARG